jgi:hypothetical protein
VARRTYLWTDDGIANARRNGLELEEVGQALHAPPGLRYERRVEEALVIVMGMADSGRVVAVLCDHLSGETYLIKGARALAGSDLDEWRRRIQ